MKKSEKKVGKKFGSLKNYSYLCTQKLISITF